MYLSTKGGKIKYINLLKSYNGAQCIRNKTICHYITSFYTSH